MLLLKPHINSSDKERIPQGKFAVPHVLIVEDESVLRELIKQELTEHQLQVTTAEDGETATQLLSTKRFDLLLLDVALPKLDGFGVLAYMQNSFISVPTVILSNSFTRESRALGEALGAKEFLIKANMQAEDLWTLAQKYLKSESEPSKV